MKTSSWTVLCYMALLAACAGPATRSTGTPVTSDLKVTSGVGRLKGRLTIKNTGSAPVTIEDLGRHHFRIETADGKPMVYRGKAQTEAPRKLIAGESLELEFFLQDDFPFWDRRTKYRVWFDHPQVRSNQVLVWF